MLQTFGRSGPIFNRAVRFTFSDRRAKLDQSNKISKRWDYLLERAKEEHPLSRMKEYDEHAVAILKQQYRFGFTHEELANENIMIKRALSMNNASFAEIMRTRKQNTIQKYQRHFIDTGSPQVQAAAMCERVIQGMIHMEKNQQDTKCARKMIQMVTRRRKMLNALKKRDYHYYRWIISQYGITHVNYPNHKEYFLHRFTFQARKQK